MRELKGSFNEEMMQDAIPFDSEECERERQEYFEEIRKRNELNPEQSIEVLKCVLPLIPSKYRRAQYRVSKEAGYVDADVPGYRIDFRYSNGNIVKEDTFVFKCVESRKVN